MRNILPFLYINLVYAIASIFGMLHHIGNGFFFDSPLWDISKLMFRDTFLYASLFTIVSIYAILLICAIFHIKVEL